ncbi:uncharacterized protein LOC116343429 [Contarinia nasturtii]|uniref:uncharacterized protein LOC116343429 n=1 Tax=Contarinia nasturtii TaxID=265458 RepID=UPI0012D3AB74|nr:uncharacterized protein LOC116343429 [Contarinia nasturtii]
MTLNNEVPNIDEILGERIKTGLMKVLKSQSSLDNIKLSFEPGSKKGANFMGEIYRIFYEDANDSENKSQTSSLILKMAPRNLMRREKLRSRHIFLREIDMYDKVLSYFHGFQLSKGVDPKENGFNEYPKCYSSISDDLSESLFLEDLLRRKFEMIDVRKEPVTFDHMSLMLKALGKFHAVSFALKDQQPEKFKELANLAFEQYWTMIDSGYSSFYLDALKRLTDILEMEKRSDLLEKFNNAAGRDHFSNILRMISSEAAEPYAVICHGDLTTNNTMFCKDEQGKPIEIQLFDFQFTRYASPVIDLILYLFCSISTELRNQHYEEFLRIYHESLSDLVRRLGSDPQTLFPFERVLDQLRKIGVYSIYVGALLLPILGSDPDKLPDIDNEASNKNCFQVAAESRKAYNQKVIDMFDDLARFQYI